MTVDIYIYAEKRESGSWKSCYPIESFEQGETSYSDMRRVYENDVLGGSFELFRVLLNAHRLQIHEADTVAQPRGLPDDLSPELREVVSWREGCGLECYYSSWLLVEELLQLPWVESGTNENGLLNTPQHNISNDAHLAEQRSEAITKMVRASYYAECCQRFRERTVPLLRSFGPPDQVRIVFCG